MEVIANDLKLFEQDITDYTGSYNKLDKSQQDLRTHIGELHKMWEGEAHEALMETFNKDYDNVLKIVAFLKEIKGDMDYAKQEYTSCEASVGNIISGMEV